MWQPPSWKPSWISPLPIWWWPNRQHQWIPWPQKPNCGHRDFFSIPIYLGVMNYWCDDRHFGGHLEFHLNQYGGDQIDSTNGFLDPENLGIDTNISSLFQSVQELWLIGVTAAILAAILDFWQTHRVTKMQPNFFLLLYGCTIIFKSQNAGTSKCTRDLHQPLDY